MLATAVLVLVGLSTSAAQADSAAEADGAAQAPVSTLAESNHAWTWWKNPSKNTNGGLAEIRSYGENIAALDFYKDGWGTRAQLQVIAVDSNGSRYWKNYGGVCFDDTSRGNSSAGRTVCDRNVAEGRYFRVHVWASKSGTYKWHSYSPSIKA